MVSAEEVVVVVEEEEEEEAGAPRMLKFPFTEETVWVDVRMVRKVETVLNFMMFFEEKI